MNDMQQNSSKIKYWNSRFNQRGGLTIFSAILILILMTTVLVYATRSSVFESRISGNEVKQKEAF
jgi:Tfp pilus assembly protein PilX